jgi:dTDP-4-amino-4,6-dideoxygalactose transaminase
LINFGITSPVTVESIGTNAKMNEFEAAMGLCVLDEVKTINQQRLEIWQEYTKTLSNIVKFQKWNKFSENNCAYTPVLFKSESQLIEVQQKLNQGGIFPKRYFYPSLDSLDYLESKNYCIKSRSIASRILCLPIYPGLSLEDQKKIIKFLT